MLRCEPIPQSFGIKSKEYSTFTNNISTVDRYIEASYLILNPNHFLRYISHKRMYEYGVKSAKKTEML